MEAKGRESSNSTVTTDDEKDLRRGPWTVDEDLTLFNYIATHGEGRWNSLARSAGLKRTGKSCRLRWLNYLRPDVRRGNITLEEQLLILELHSRWGNRWSKIAQYLPGRTDNEIKNYWRTRVQKQAKQLKCDVNSKLFKDTMRYLWMPRLAERIQAAGATPSAAATTTTAASPTLSTATTVATNAGYNYQNNLNNNDFELDNGNMVLMSNGFGASQIRHTYTSENSTAASSDSFGTQVSPISDLTDCYNIPVANNNPNSDYYQPAQINYSISDSITSPLGFFTNQGWDFQSMEPNNLQWVQSGDTSDNFWDAEDMFLQYKLNYNM